jgi:tetratricopeptide (TPR) repeat protein
MLKREEMYPRAKQLLGEVLEKQNRVLGETDRDSLQTSQLYAAAVNNVDGPVKAAPLYHHTLDLRRQTFGDNDPDTVQSMSATSNVLHDLGNLSEAEQLAKAAYEWRANKFGPTNVTTLPSLLSYGSILTEEGRAKEAAPLLKTLVEQDTKVFGEFKLGTMRAESAYAAALTALGIFDKAESIYAELLHATSTGPVGEFALHTLAAKSGYANMLLQRNRSGDLASAEPLAKKAVEGLSEKRPGFRETLFANHVYAQVLDKLGKTDEANKQYDLAVSGAEKLFGKACPITQRYAADYAQFRTRVGKSGVAKGS